MEIEFVALSRGVPWMFALIVNPYLRSIPRDCLTDYIHATQKALSPNDSEPGRGNTVKVEIPVSTRVVRQCFVERPHQILVP